ncbi:MAG: ABC transporter ATP-binding protein [Micromonosporaceae bacterium]|nr:ABC transporter ATP-binding protein [Micromonosporaceae bacterium]
MNLLRDLWSASAGRTAAVALLILLAAAAQAGSAPLAGQVLANRSAPAFAALAVTLATAVFADVGVGLLLSRLTSDWAARVRRSLCRVAFGQELPKLETTPVGELLDRIDNDVYNVGAQVRGEIRSVAQFLTTSVLSIVTALVVWWPAGVGMLVISGVLVLWLRPRLRALGPARLAEEEAWSDVAAVTEEAIHGQDDVRTSLARPYVLGLFARRASQVLARGRRVWRLTAEVSVIASTVVRAAVIGVAVAGAYLLTTRDADPARLTAIWLLVLSFCATVEHLSRLIPELQTALGSWRRVELLRAAEQEPVGGVAPVDGDLEVRGLTFRYADDDPPESSREGGDRPAVLRDVTLTFHRGRSYAVIGRTGSGKSTLARILTRAVDVPRGTVFLGGTDLMDLDLAALRRWVAIVPQRTDIIAGTLAENVALFDPSLMDRVGPALDELGLTSWVADLPDGIDTRLGEGGYVLSAGQAQLVAFARIMVRDPRIVILDEATARMDPVTEARVQQATERLLTGRIGIIIAHRLSSVRRCDEVVVLADGVVVEAGPLRDSQRFAALMAAAEDGGRAGEDGWASPDESRSGGVDGALSTVYINQSGEGGVPAKTDPPPLPPSPPVRTLREIIRLTLNDPRYGVTAVALFFVMSLLGTDGVVLPFLWAHLVDGVGTVVWPALAIVVASLLRMPGPYFTSLWFPEWWVRQMLRINLRLVHGQTGPRRVSNHTPGEVVAQAGDTERVVFLADNTVDQVIACGIIVAMTVVSGTWVPAVFFGATMLVSGGVATLFGPMLERAGRRTVAARAAFASVLASCLTAARTVKLAGATGPVLDHLARLDRARSDRQQREISIQVFARSTPAMISGLLPIGAWALYLGGGLSAAATLVTVATLGSARWFAWTTASLVSGLPSARVWTRRTVQMAGEAAYSSSVPGVDLSAGTGPAPPAVPRHPLRLLELRSFTAVHEDGTVGVRDVDLTVRRGELVLVIGPVGSGKSSLLRAMAGIVHHTGDLCWNGNRVTEPEVFLRPNQVGYVSQLPRVLTGTVVDNIELGRDVDVSGALATAQMRHDLAAAGDPDGHALLVGHKGIRLSGGQLQRLALARALAPGTELLLADDVSSALDVTTELALWQALRERGVTVVGSTSKRAALVHADQVLVLVGGRVVDRGRWDALSARWGHLAG